MKIVAIREQAEGNESIGTMWSDTAIFNGEDSIEKVILWSVKFHSKGRLILTVPELLDSGQ